MSRAILFRPMLRVMTFCLATTTLHAEDPIPPAASPPPYPPQLEILVPHEPSAFASDGQQHLLYELVLRNFESNTIELKHVAVMDADTQHAVAEFDAAQLPALIRRVGGRTNQPGTVIPNGGSVTLYLMLSFDADEPVPDHLQHHVVTSLGELRSENIVTHHDVVQMIGPPVTGTNWLAETGLSNDNGHRRGNMVQRGHSTISRRYAFDWVQVENGAMFAGDEKANTAYHGYGETLVAVADGIVVSVKNEVPENVPLSPPVVPVTLETTTGNHVILDIGHGQYAHYMHLKDGSLHVQAGNSVHRGEVLGVIGNSGDSFLPHLHFEITNSPEPLAGQGVPYVFESFTVLEDNGEVVPHKVELPMEKMLVRFSD